MSFTVYRQLDQMDCGPTCLRMIAKHYGRRYSLQFLRDRSMIGKEGVSILGICQAAEKIGLRAIAARVNFKQLENDIDLPCILYWDQSHFVVLPPQNYSSKKGNKKIKVADPSVGTVSIDKESFLKKWQTDSNKSMGIVILFYTTPIFFSNKDEENNSTVGFSFFFSYLKQYKRLFFQLFMGLGVGSILQLIFPFLTQSIVDIGINTRNLNFITIVLIAQCMLFLGKTSIEFIRSWILLHISTRLNISIITDFLTKLMKLPISFFDSKKTGDIMQRIQDQKRIESFFTGTTLNVIFSWFNLIAFSGILAYYNLKIFSVFLFSSVLYIIWVMIFQKRRKELDYKKFDISSQNQGNIVQLISGMQEIKLNNCELQKRWEWEHIQAKLFRYNVKSLALGQYQQAGAIFINEGKNIFITFLVAKLVVDGNLTLGAMMAVQYIIGQLNSPIEQLLGFMQQFQDAKISIERLNEIHDMQDEESNERSEINEISFNKNIQLHNLSFAYPGAGNDLVLSNINLNIPQGKTTAIVGMSGSGKTTILKLLLRFYEPQKGEVKVGSSSLSQISFRYWRSLCGVVMQDGFIFSDSIAKNIAVGDEHVDKAKLKHAIQVANITEFIESLPLGLNTKIGSEGNGISQGQKQRILIARAVYKNPEYIFFDEATNALDANNEKVIMENLEDFFKGRTVVVVAHRLSTVKNADNIVVLDKGVIVEQGTHAALTKIKGEYYNLVKNQLELGN